MFAHPRCLRGIEANKLPISLNPTAKVEIMELHGTQGPELDGEIAMYDVVDELDIEDVRQRVYKNAQKMDLEVTDEHLDVIETLIRYYQTHCTQSDCLEAHRHMRFLEKEYSDKGGSKYLYKLFSADTDTNGVLHIIHKLAELPGLRLDVDKGFGTAF